MLAPEENMPVARRAEIFAAMADELPWPSLKSYILANNQFAKSCLVGGHRLEPKHRARFQALLLKEAEKNEFSQTFCSPIFAQWYPVHETLYKKLEDYFHSDAYKSYRQEQGLAEDAYQLPAERFSEFFSVEDLDKWRILLLFSPLQFTQEQTREILDSVAGNVVLIRRVRELEERDDATRRDVARLTAESERLNAQVAATAEELQELRRARRDLTAERNDLQQKFEGSQAENRRLRQAAQDQEAITQAAVAKAQASLQQERQRLQNALDKLERECTDWRLRYEQQRVEFKSLQELQARTEAERARASALAADWEHQTRELHAFADLVLGRIDWVQVGRNLHLTPVLQRQFNSVMKKLNYEDPARPTIEDTLPVFWERLASQERTVIEQVAQSNTLEVSHGTATEFWAELKEPYEDVIIGLEARVMLMKLMRELFYQTLEQPDLEIPRLPKSRAADD
jgi:hypothetical protein